MKHKNYTFLRPIKQFLTLGIVATLGKFSYDYTKESHNYDHSQLYAVDRTTSKTDEKPEQFKLLKKIAADNVVTDNELLEYGTAIKLISIVANSESDSLELQAKLQKKRFKKSTGKLSKAHQVLTEETENGYFTLDKKTLESTTYVADMCEADTYYNVDDMLEMSEAAEKNYISFPLALAKDDLPHVLLCDRAALLEMKLNFLASQSILGLRQIPLFIGNGDVSDADVDNISVNISLSDISSNKATYFVMDYELAHIKSQTDKSPITRLINDYTEMVRNWFSLPADKEEENKADEQAIKANPENLKGAFETFIGLTGNCTRKEFVDNMQSLNKPDNSDNHAPNIERIKTMMKIAANYYGAH